MKKNVLAFCMFLLLACTAMFADGGPKPVLCPPKQQCPAVVSPAPVKPVVVVADGSDPMPLCRNRDPLNCPKVAPKAVVIRQFVPRDAFAFDGGPIPLCSPKCQWSPEHCTFYCPAVLPKD